MEKTMSQPQAPLSDVLKQALATSGMAHIDLERATGVKRASIMRFLRGETSLRLDKADRLAAYFGLELRPWRKQ
jgi:plasmid maintenance system antidote protein VapI